MRLRARPFLLALALARGAAAQVAPAAPAPAPEPTPQGPVRVEATPAKTDVTVGETFALELKASGPAGATYTFPGEASTDAFELRSPAAASDAPAPPAGVHRYDAAVFALGAVEIPPIPVRYRLPDGTAGEASSPAVKLRVLSLLPKGEEPKLADVKPPVPVGVGRAFWVALALAAAVGVAFAVWLWRRFRRKPGAAPEVPVPPVEPDVEAMRALDALEARHLLAHGEHRAFYIALTAVAKRYLERRLAAPILEMTTAETLAFLRGHPKADGLHTTVRDVAEAADRIKFARAEGLAAEAERHMASVRGLVATLEARLAPPPAADDGGKAA
ncbi:MAG: hypothetical protein U0599_21245 [Vicinamibacteria bacterium]